MRWKQFFTRVDSLNCDETKKFMQGKKRDEINLVDVRQPKEYSREHLPGAILMPLPDLNERINELDPSKPTVVY